MIGGKIKKNNRSGNPTKKSTSERMESTTQAKKMIHLHVFFNSNTP